MIITTSETVTPIWRNAAYFERDLDPWHAEAFPNGFKDAAPNQGPKRSTGWMACDWAGNPIQFIPDGTKFDTFTGEIVEE